MRPSCRSTSIPSPIASPIERAGADSELSLQNPNKRIGEGCERQIDLLNVASNLLFSVIEVSCHFSSSSYVKAYLFSSQPVEIYARSDDSIKMSHDVCTLTSTLYSHYARAAIFRNHISYYIE